MQRRILDPPLCGRESCSHQKTGALSVDSNGFHRQHASFIFYLFLSTYTPHSFHRLYFRTLSSFPTDASSFTFLNIWHTFASFCHFFTVSNVRKANNNSLLFACSIVLNCTFSPGPRFSYSPDIAAADVQSPSSPAPSRLSVRHDGSPASP